MSLLTCGTLETYIRVAGTYATTFLLKRLVPVILCAAFGHTVVSYGFTATVMPRDLPRVVIVDSYHHGYRWSDHEIEGFLNRMREVYALLDPPIEHLDAKRRPGKDVAILMKNLLKEKYASRHIDLVVAFDNAALDLLLQDGKEVFPGVPIVFGGINDFKSEMLRGRQDVTGVAQVMDYRRTLDIALKLHPQTKEVLVIHDYTVTGLAVHKEIEALIPFYSDRVPIRFLPPSTFQQAAQTVQSLPADSLGLLVAFDTDRDERSLPIDQGTSELTALSRAPIYGTQETRLGHGIVGGELLSGKDHGRRVADMALRVLRGEKPESIPIDRPDCSTPMFDYRQLQRFNVSLSVLPAGSVVIDKPVPFIERYRILTMWTLGVLGALLALVIALAAALFRLTRTQKKLEKSEANYKLIVETASEGICAMDADYRITFVNQRLADMGGYSAEDLIGVSIDSFVLEEERSAHRQEMDIRRSGQSSIYERQCERRDGSRVWARVAATPILNPDGSFAGSFAMFTDVTEQKTIHDALEESERLYRNLFAQTKRQEELHRSLLNCSADPIVVYDLEGRVQYLNPAHTKLFGWTLEEVQGQRLNAVSEGDPLASLAVIDDLLSQGSLPPSYDTQHFTRDGRLIDVSVSGAKYVDHAGNPAGLVVIIHDISDRKRVEESLRESEERFRLAFETANIGVCIVARDGRLLRANDQMCQTIGYPRSQLETMSVNDITHPDDLSIGMAFMQRAWEGEADRGDFEKRYIHKLGHVVEGRVTSSLVRDGQGSPLYFISHVLDITEHKRAERALTESERRLATLLANLPGIAYRCANDPNWSMKFISEGCAALTGYAPRDLVDNETMSYADLIHPEDRLRVWDQIQEAVASGKAFELEYRIRTRSGEEKWVWERGIGVPSKAHRDTELEGFISEITERKRMEHALQESEERYRAVVENLHIGIAVINPQMEIVAFNRFFRKIYPRVQPGMKQVCRGMCDARDGTGKCQDCPCAKTFQDGSVHEVVKENQVDDRLHSYRIVSCPIKDGQGQVEFAIELVEDITETRALQLQLAQAQKLEAVGTLAGGVAHDFNNLLQVVLGYADLLLSDEKFPREFEDDLRKITEASRNGADLVKRLLTFSRKTPYRPHAVDLNQRIEQLKKMLARTIPKMISIETLLCPNLARINADPSQIDQILMNLTLNSRDAMPDGGTLVIQTANVTLDELYCKTHPEAKACPHVLLSVSDTGQGMDKETLEHIFEPFYTTKETGKGTGLGLAMVYGIVQQHDGHIRCSSEPGSGTEFRIYFPAISEHGHAEEPDVGPLIRRGSGLILLVDDEPVVRDLCQRILQKGGYQVIAAANGREALERYVTERENIALVLLDLIMPEMGGKQCLAELLRLDPSVKVVIASGYSADGPTGSMIDEGAKGFIAKPYEMREVLQVIGEVLAAP